MGEENKPGAVKGIELEKQGIEEVHLLVKKVDPVTMTEMSTNRDKRIENETLIDNLNNQTSNNSNSPEGSFLSIENGQNSEEEKEPDPAMAGKVKILKFEDNLTSEDSRQLKLSMTHYSLRVERVT